MTTPQLYADAAGTIPLDVATTPAGTIVWIRFLVGGLLVPGVLTSKAA